jgi:hypothetical protein
MNIHFLCGWDRALRLVALCLAVAAVPSFAHNPAQPNAVRPVPMALQVRGELAPLADTTDLKFGDFFKRPVGPRGLETTPLLRSLDGQRVRIVGYMVRQDSTLGVTGLLVLAPLPVTMGEEDESFADDLPASALYVHLAEAQQAQRLPHMPGLMALTGTLQLGAVAEPDGRRSMVRLLLDDAVSREFEPPASANHPSFSAFLERLNEPTR